MRALHWDGQRLHLSKAYPVPPMVDSAEGVAAGQHAAHPGVGKVLLRASPRPG